MKIILVSIIFCFPILGFGQSTNQDTIRIEKIASKIKDEMFDIGFKKQDIPAVIKHKLSKIDKIKFKIANKGEAFNSGDALQKKSLPNKRIVYVAHNDNLYIITYEQSGFGSKYYSRIIEYQKKHIKCIITLLVPPHNSIEDFKSILDRRKWLNYVPNKSLCLL